jgi:hypothetical protein
MNRILPTNKKNNKKPIATISIAILIVWIIFSVVYMANDQWSDFQLVKMQQAYKSGIDDSVRTVIEEADKCSMVPLYDGNQKIDVVSVKCLSQQVAENTETQNTEDIDVVAMQDFAPEQEEGNVEEIEEEE